MTAGIRPAPILALMAAAVLIHAPFFDAFAVPYPDFFSYHEQAEAFLRGELPAESKRLPAFPLLIAGGSLLLPGPDDGLRAAELLNLALLPVCLWLIHLVSAAFVGRGAALAIASLCAVNMAMMYSAIQPNIELTVLACLLAVVALALRGSAWAYVAAFGAALTRHEIALVIPLLVLQDGLTRRRSWSRALAAGAAASSGLVLWLALHVAQSGQRNAYLTELVTRTPDRIGFLDGSVRVAADFLPAGVLASDAARAAIAGLFFVTLFAGFVTLARQRGARLVLVAGFFLGYGAVHVVYPAYLPRYTVPVLWIAYLFCAAALQALAGRLPALRSRPARIAGAVALGAVLACGLVSAARYVSGDYVRTKRGTFRAAAEWYRAAARPGDRLVTTLPKIVGYYSRPAAVVYSGTLTGETADAVLEAVRAGGITHVLWDSDYAYDDSYDAARHRARLLTLLVEQRPGALQLVREFQRGRERSVVYRVLPGRGG